MSNHLDLPAIPVPKPFTLLRDRELIGPGDIRLLPGTTEWEDTQGCEIDTFAPGTGILYARLVLPDQMRIARFEERISSGDLAWVDGVTRGWVLADRLLWRNGLSSMITVKEFFTFFKEKLAAFGRMFVAKPADVDVNKPLVPRPSGSRDLFPSDVLRPWDMLIGNGARAWRCVPELLYGRKVRDLGPQLKDTWFIRPTGPNSRNWWVCEVEGRSGSLGSFQDPFPSLDEASRNIEEACRIFRIAPIGVIWRKADRIPLMVYDPKLPQVSDGTGGLRPPGVPPHQTQITS